MWTWKHLPNFILVYIEYVLLCLLVCSWDNWLHLSPPSSGVAAHLFVQTLQLHFQGLQEALPLDQLVLGSSQSLVALLDLVLHRLQLDRTQNSHMNAHVLYYKMNLTIACFPLTFSAISSLNVIYFYL